MVRTSVLVTLIWFLAFTVVGCNNQPQKSAPANAQPLSNEHTDSAATNSSSDSTDENANFQSFDIDSEIFAKLAWVDTPVQQFLDKSDNELIKAARQSGIKDEYLWDRLEKRNSSTYLVLHIGHDYEDNDGRRFVTDMWLYVDTATRKLYEYDLAKDNLKAWEPAKN